MPRKRKSINMPRRKNPNREWQQQIKRPLRTPKSQFYNMAVDSRAPRLRGCSVVQTEFPRSLVIDGVAGMPIVFKTAFLSGGHLYAFYRETRDRILYLGRLCTFSQTWQRLTSFRRLLHYDMNIKVLALPWYEPAGRQFLLFTPNHCSLMTLNPPSAENAVRRRGGGAGQLGHPPPEATMTTVDLLSMLAVPDDIVINVELNLYVKWQSVAVDPDAQAVYALLKVGFSYHDEGHDLAIFRLDWATRLWTRLALPETAQTLLQTGHHQFMAIHGGYLYIGVSQVKTTPADVLHSLDMVQRVNLSTLAIDRIQVTGKPNYLAVISRQSFVAYAPVVGSDTVYLMNTVVNTADPVRSVAKNQLWALNLPSMRLRQINDGPQGLTPAQLWRQASAEGGDGGAGAGAAAADAAPTMLMRHFTLAAALDGSQLWALTTEEVDYRRNPRQTIRMYRINLADMPTLASLAVDSLLHRRPLKCLLSGPATGTRTRASRQRVVHKQARTVAYLRDFIQRKASDTGDADDPASAGAILRPFVEGHLPQSTEGSWTRAPREQAPLEDERQRPVVENGGFFRWGREDLPLPFVVAGIDFSDEESDGGASSPHYSSVSEDANADFSDDAENF